ncbi:MAG: DNA cytosine methyltransferase [Crocosphaera sp.]|nr:DNA cytosine methyltransferase [Crocosphaera sp.]
MKNAIIGFAGGGGVEIGMMAAGINPILAIECDPQKPELSKAIADVYEQNFHTPLLRQTIQQWANAGFPGCPYEIDFAHFSPVCCNFSVETNRGDLEQDISAAMAIADFISAKQPKVFTLENVPAYASSTSWHIIQNSLLDNGYLPNSKVYDFADYGVPQRRKRFFCVAMKNRWFPEIQKTCPVGWFEAIKDVIPTLKPTSLTANQAKAIQKACHHPILIPRIGYRDRCPSVTPGNQPAPTIKRSLFDDGKGSRRSQVWTVVTSPRIRFGGRHLTIWDGSQALNCNLEVFRRLQTFPVGYKFSGDIRVDGSILGNSVPPLFIQKIYGVLCNSLIGASITC